MTTNVLIVEDDKMQRLLIRKIIDDGQRNITEVETAHEGLLYARENLVDILLLDLNLPGRFDGFSLCEALRRDYRHTNLKVLIITGYDDPQDRAEAERLKVDGYLLKPIDAKALLSMVNQFSVAS